MTIRCTGGRGTVDNLISLVVEFLLWPVRKRGDYMGKVSGLQPITGSICNKLVVVLWMVYALLIRINSGHMSSKTPCLHGFVWSFDRVVIVLSQQKSFPSDVTGLLHMAQNAIQLIQAGVVDHQFSFPFGIMANGHTGTEALSQQPLQALDIGICRCRNCGTG